MFLSEMVGMLRRPIWLLEVRHEVDLRPGAAIDRAEESARNLGNNHDGKQRDTHRREVGAKVTLPRPVSLQTHKP
jgi:hypothetical protein